MPLNALSTVIFALSTADFTNAVVASCVVLVPAAAVGAVGVPVSAGLARGAFAASAALITLFCTGFVDVPLNALSTVIFALSTAVFTNAVLAACVVLVPAAAVGTVGVPVNAGLARGAFWSNRVLCAAAA